MIHVTQESLGSCLIKLHKGDYEVSIVMDDTYEKTIKSVMRRSDIKVFSGRPDYMCEITKQVLGSTEESCTFDTLFKAMKFIDSK